jgi:hypothetical protein
MSEAPRKKLSRRNVFLQPILQYAPAWLGHWCCSLLSQCRKALGWKFRRAAVANVTLASHFEACRDVRTYLVATDQGRNATLRRYRGPRSHRANNGRPRVRHARAAPRRDAKRTLPKNGYATQRSFSGHRR